MIKIYDNDIKNYVEEIKKAAQAVLDFFNINEKDIDIEINLTNCKHIKELNNKYRNIDKVTDVLSFANIAAKYPYCFDKINEYKNPQDQSLILGEIFICEEKAAQQAQEYGHSEEREISFLTCHGMLHLLGYDHMEADEEKEMNKVQDQIMDKLIKKRNRK